MKFNISKIILYFLSISTFATLTAFYFFAHTELIDTKSKTKLQIEYFNSLRSLDNLNTAMGRIENSEKPFVIAGNKLNQDDISNNYLIATTAIASIKKINHPNFKPFDIAILDSIVQERINLSKIIILLSLQNKPDIAIKLHNGIAEKILTNAFLNKYQSIYDNAQNASEKYLAEDLNNTDKSYRNISFFIILLILLILTSLILLNKTIISKDTIIRDNVLYRNIITNSSDAIVICDKYLHITFCNDAAKKMYKLQEKDMIGKMPDDVFGLRLSQKEKEAKYSSLLTTGHWQGINAHTDAEGNYIDMYTTIDSIKDAGGKVLHYFSTSTNITPVKKAQEEAEQLSISLAALNKQLEQRVKEQTDIIKEAFERVQDGFIATDTNFIINYANATIKTLTNFVDSPIETESVFTIFKLITGNSYKELIGTCLALQQKKSFNFSHLRTNKWYRVNIFPSPQGLSFYLKDITTSKKAEDEIKKQRRLYEFSSKINDLILHATTQQEIFSSLCDITVNTGGFIFAWIGFPHIQTQKLVPTKWAGKEDGYFQVIEKISIEDNPAGRGPAGNAFRNAACYYANDIATDAAMLPWSKEALKRNYRGSISLPLMIRKKVIGVYTAYSDTANLFTEEEVELLKRIADNINYALTAIEINNEKAITENQLTKISQAIEQSSASVIITDINGNIEYVNPAFTATTGYSFAEVMGKNPRFLKSGITPDETYKEMWGNLLQQKEWEGEIWNKKKNGEIYCERVIISPIKNKNGHTTNYVAVKENITQQKQLEEEEKRLTTILENSTAIVAIANFNRDYVYINPAGRAMLEIEPTEDISKLNAATFRSEKYQKLTVEEINPALLQTGKWIGENSYVSRSGKEVIVTQVVLVTKKDSNGNPIEVSSIALDITQQKQLEEEEKKLVTIIENSPVAVSIVNLKRDFIYLNNAGRALLEIGEEEDITTLSVNNFRTEENARITKELINPAIILHGKWIGENSYLSRSGKLIDVKQIMIVSKKDEAGLPLEISVISVDISENKKNEKELQLLNTELRTLSQHLQEISEIEKKQIAREIHDELGQDLTAMKFDISWLKKHIATDRDKLENKVDELMKTITNTMASVRRIHTSIHPAMLDELGLRTTVDWLLASIRKTTELSIKFDSNLIPTQPDKIKSLALYRVIQESLTNVMRYAQASHVTIHLTEQNNILTLKIKDDGCGFDIDTIDTTLHHGLLGIRERIYAINGTTNIESVIGKGTTTTITVAL